MYRKRAKEKNTRCPGMNGKEAGSYWRSHTLVCKIFTDPHRCFFSQIRWIDRRHQFKSNSRWNDNQFSPSDHDLESGLSSPDVIWVVSWTCGLIFLVVQLSYLPSALLLDT
ncbi:hypothetical protein AVEN_191335-1 [Araneus ventricosus]|uniref:Uncharacterized protein n=1 Tax=Araneus ventricosus TaxID=182803 RepID=A0A4Y1ZP68_ARAVE|nr:hypothetical protein AVEN_191335-1 [Araneus ventricosus]